MHAKMQSYNFECTFSSTSSRLAEADIFLVFALLCISNATHLQRLQWACAWACFATFSCLRVDLLLLLQEPGKWHGRGHK